MKVKLLYEAGYDEAMLGLSLSYDQPVANMPAVTLKLLPKGGSHIKFLESMMVWLDITAARYWWQQFDTYRIVTKQSGSTMHILTKQLLTQDDFEGKIAEGIIVHLDRLIQDGDLLMAKRVLPEGFLQRRIVCASYKTLRRILKQRQGHKLPIRATFRQAILTQTEHPEFLEEHREASDG